MLRRDHAHAALRASLSARIVRSGVPKLRASRVPHASSQAGRRIATRYQKRADNYLGILTIGAIFLWLYVCRYALVRTS
jgi:hypothetical protein